MEKKTKILIGCIIAFAFLCFLIAFLISNNKTYTITFDSNGGTYVSSQKIKKNGYVSKPVNPTKVGYEFVEWQFNGKKYDFTLKVKKDITLKAIWQEEKKKNKVELEVEGVKKTVDIKDGDTIDLSKLNLEDKIGYEIKWYLNDKEFDIENTKITNNLTLVGRYEEVKVYTVKFDSNGGTKVEDLKVNENRTIKEPTDPEKDGYILEGWYLDNQKYDFKTKVTSDITLKAKWVEDKNVKRYTVTFDSVGGNYISSQKVIQNKKAVEPTNPTKNDYKFVEWQLDGKKYDFNSKVTKDIVLKAKWQHIVSYNVTFNSDGGSINQSMKVEYGTKVGNPGIPTKNGYVFLGWYSKGGKYNFDSAITEDITITANWRELYKYTVKFNLNGGNCSSCSDQIITEGNKAVNPGTPTRGGYTFVGWDYDFNNVVSSNLTINAKWNEVVYKISIAPVDKYSVDGNLVVMNGSTQVTNIKSINYSDGVYLCSGRGDA